MTEAPIAVRLRRFCSKGVYLKLFLTTQHNKFVESREGNIFHHIARCTLLMTANKPTETVCLVFLSPFQFCLCLCGNNSFFDSYCRTSPVDECTFCITLGFKAEDCKGRTLNHRRWTRLEMSGSTGLAYSVYCDVFSHAIHQS